MAAYAKELGPRLESGADRLVWQKAAGRVRKDIPHNEGRVTSPSFSGRAAAETRGSTRRSAAAATMVRRGPRERGGPRGAGAAGDAVWVVGRGWWEPGPAGRGVPQAARGLEAWGGRLAAILEPSALGLPRGARAGRPWRRAGGLKRGRSGLQRGLRPRAWLGPLEVALSSGTVGDGARIAFWPGFFTFLTYFSKAKQNHTLLSSR